MVSAQKRQKSQQQIQDRISSLPDAILCHILSFLPTKHAVATAVLSTRWQYLFTSLTHLDFDDSLHSASASFVKFVYRVLLHRNVSHVIQFRLTCRRDYDSDHVNAWISSAIWHKVEELVVDINMRKSNVIPPSLFSCGTLVDLKLCCNVSLAVPSDVFLPHLKILELYFVKFADDDTMKRLFSGCPVLVHLVITYCKMDNVRVLDISLPTLECLTIICQLHGDYSTEFCKFEVVFDVPKLEYLKYTGYVAEGYSLKSLGSVVEAEIWLGLSKGQKQQDFGRTRKGRTYSKLIYDLIAKISDVRFLYLSGCTINALNRFWQPTKYPNLTHLELGDSIISRRLPDILESSPNLEQLVFNKKFITWNSSRHHVPETVPLCLSLHIKEIVIREFLGKKDELKMVEYFLKSAKVLKKMAIYSDLPLGEKWCLSQKLLKFPRCSEACQIVLSCQSFQSF